MVAAVLGRLQYIRCPVQHVVRVRFGRWEGPESQVRPQQPDPVGFVGGEGTALSPNQSADLDSGFPVQLAGGQVERLPGKL